MKQFAQTTKFHVPVCGMWLSPSSASHQKYVATCVDKEDKSIKHWQIHANAYVSTRINPKNAVKCVGKEITTGSSNAVAKSRGERPQLLLQQNKIKKMLPLKISEI